MRLHKPLPRTGVTDLADDELLLFDAVFDSAWPIHALRSSEYGRHLRVEYTHGIGDEDLGKRVGDLVDRGLMIPCRDPLLWRNLEYFGLTPAGGALWELEREPDWQKYCSDSYDDGYMTCDAFCAQTARDFLCAIVAAGWESLDMMAATCRRFEQREPRPRPLIPWKASAVDYSIVVPTRGRVVRQPGEADTFAEYETRRSWWRVLDELATLQQRN